MKQAFLAFCFILFFSQPLFADGSFQLQDLKPILNQNPVLANYLFSTLDFAAGGVASRIGDAVNDRLGGKRVSPYRVLAKPKGTKGAYIFEVVVYTDKIFLDEKSNVTTLEKAFSVIEKFQYIEIRKVEGKSQSATQLVIPADPR
ncbi:MAG: hypothetical protein ACR2LC_07460 [Pyrinomonadaceae bacterium]